MFAIGTLIRVTSAANTFPSHGLPVGHLGMIVKWKEGHEWYVRSVISDDLPDSFQVFIHEFDMTPVDLQESSYRTTEELDAEARKLLGVNCCPTCGRRYDHDADAA